MRRALLPALLVCGIGLPGAALAQAPAANQTAPGVATTPQNPVPGTAGQGSPTAEPAPGEPGFFDNLFSSSRNTLLGDAYGLRTFLGRYGISLGLQETSEVKGNPTGGIHTGAAYNGLTTVSLGLDTARAFGLPGGTFNVSAFQIHGRNYSIDQLGSLQTASGIEAARATRLWELWYQQVLVENGLDIKVGQQSLDQEFIISSYSGLFVNTSMGWPLVPSLDLYAGGPAYPLASLGVRLRAQPFTNVTVLGGVFDDNPPGGPFFDDSQVRGASQSGTKFNTGTGALFIAELQYAVNQPALGELDRGGAKGLPGTYKLGGWYDTGKFFDQRFGVDGLSLADSGSAGVQRTRRHNFSLYGVMDQMVWRPDPGQAQAVGIFLRVMGAPGDRNLANFSANGGITLKAPFHGRDNDTAGLGFGVAKIGPNAVRITQDSNDLFGGYPVRSSEQFVELTYQAQIAPWWAVQPDFQYVWTPGGGVPNPNQPGRRIGNEAVFGLRTNVTF